MSAVEVMSKVLNPTSSNILLVLPEAFNCVGGIQMFSRALCLAAGKWAQRSHGSVSALVLNDSEKPDARYVNGNFASYAGAGKSKSKLVAQFLRQVASTQHDWIIFGHVSLAPLALLAKRIRPGVKTCVVTYGIEVWQPLTKLQRRALGQADLVLAISEFTRSEVVKHTGVPAERIRIFPCSLDPHWEMPSSDSGVASDSLVLLSVTRMNKEDDYKGIDNVIRSLPAIVREAGSVEYRVVGQGDDLPRLRALAAELDVDRFVNFLGELSDAQLREQYQQCTLFVMPSSREGFGIVFLEAMAYGKPVVGGAHGGTPSVVKDGETGFLVESSDVEGISRSITRLLLDQGLREKLGHAGHQRLLDEFTFEQFERNFAAVINRS